MRPSRASTAGLEAGFMTIGQSARRREPHHGVRPYRASVDNSAPRSDPNTSLSAFCDCWTRRLMRCFLLHLEVYMLISICILPQLCEAASFGVYFGRQVFRMFLRCFSGECRENLEFGWTGWCLGVFPTYPCLPSVLPPPPSSGRTGYTQCGVWGGAHVVARSLPGEGRLLCLGNSGRELEGVRGWFAGCFVGFVFFGGGPAEAI